MRSFIIPTYDVTLLLRCSHPNEPSKTQLDIRQIQSQSVVYCTLDSSYKVTKIDKGNESWINDKISHEVKHSKSHELIFLYSDCDILTNPTEMQKTQTEINKFDPHEKYKL